MKDIKCFDYTTDKTKIKLMGKMIDKLEEKDKEIERLNNIINDLQQRIDKAIEYCEEITSREIDISDTDYDLGQDFTARDILKILRGEDNESN